MSDISRQSGVGRERAPDAVHVPQADVDVTARPGPGMVWLRHERDRHIFLVGDFLGPVLEEGGAIGGFDRRVVMDIDLVLTRRRLSLGEFDRYPGLSHLVAESPV